MGGTPMSLLSVGLRTKQLPEAAPHFTPLPPWPLSCFPPTMLPTENTLRVSQTRDGEESPNAPSLARGRLRRRRWNTWEGQDFSFPTPALPHAPPHASPEIRPTSPRSRAELHEISLGTNS